MPACARESLIAADACGDLGMGTEQPGLRRLPLRCTPQPDESLTSLVLRLAERNGMDWPSEVAKPAGIRSLPVFAPSSAQLEALALLSGVPAEKLAAMCAERIPNGAPRPAVRLRGVEFPADWLRPERKACPRCLGESPHHRLQWDLRHVRVCVPHACALIHACPGCGKRLDWGRPTLTRCRCGRDLTAAPAADCDTEALGAAAWIGGTVIGDRQRPPRMLAELPFAQAVEMTALTGAMLLGAPEADAFNPVSIAGHRCLAAGYAALDARVDVFDEAVGAAVTKPPGPESFRSLHLLTKVRALCLSARNPSVAPIVALLDAHFESARRVVLHQLAMYREGGQDDAGPAPGAA